MVNGTDYKDPYRASFLHPSFISSLFGPDILPNLFSNTGYVYPCIKVEDKVSHVCRT
jgi:hypothetical protein